MTTSSHSTRPLPNIVQVAQLAHNLGLIAQIHERPPSTAHDLEKHPQRQEDERLVEARNGVR